MAKAKQALEPLPRMPVWVGGVTEEMRRSLHRPPISPEERAKVKAQAKAASEREAIEARKNRFPILPVDSFARPAVGMYRFLNMRVVRDEGPASDPLRKIVLARTEPGREKETLCVRYDCVRPVPGQTGKAAAGLTGATGDT